MGALHDHEILSIDHETVSPTQVSSDVLRSALAHDENLVRTRGAKVAVSLAEEDPAAIADLAPLLVDSLDHERTTVVVHSALALANIVETAPEAAAAAVDRIVELLDEDPPIVQFAASQFVRASITAAPESCLGHLDRLVDRTVRDARTVVSDRTLDDADGTSRELLHEIDEEEGRRQWATRLVTANVIAELASVEPAAVAPHLPELVTVLDPESDDVGVMTTVADTVATVAEHDPNMVDGAVEPLVAVLGHDDRPTVATAVTALGFLGDSRAVEPLRALEADERRSPELRELAAETATFVAQRSEQ